MNGRILFFEGRRHDAAQRLLPWWVTARLGEDDHGWLAQHVEGCRQCRIDAAELRVVQAAYRQSNEQADPLAGADAGWQRLRRRLKPGRVADQANAQPRARLPVGRWMAWAVTAQAVAILVLGLSIWRPSTDPAIYRTLGSTPAGSDAQLIVLFDPDLPEARLRALVNGQQARIVDGPNATGAYVLAVPGGRLAQVRAALRAAPGVQQVETLDPGGAR